MSRAARRRAASALAPGMTIAGRYRLAAKLGEGGMAEVFRADDLASGRQVAVKVLHADVAANPEAVERFRREGQVLSELDNPAIVSVETFGELDDGAVYLVMELLEGETLGERMRRGPLESTELAPIVAGTCAGLHAAHSRGVVHRDLKPDNIYLCPTEHGLQVKLLDFGISKVYGSQKLTQTGEILGTPRYMSPEQLGAEPDIDARVDVYSLGVILYEALAGQPPFLATTPTDLVIAILHGKVAPLRSARADVSEAVEAVVMRALSKIRAARFDTAMELAEAYIDAVGGPAAIRGQQRRGMATRALGGMRSAPLAPSPSAPSPSAPSPSAPSPSAPSPDAPRAAAGSPTADVPATRPPPAPDRADPVAGNLRLGTFSELHRSPAPPGGEAAPGSKRTAAMGASPGAPIPASPGAPQPGRMVAAEEARPELARTERAIPRTRSPEEVGAGAMPATQETPREMLGDVTSSEPPAPTPRRRVAPTEMMDASHPSLAPAHGIHSANAASTHPPPGRSSPAHPSASLPSSRPPHDASDPGSSPHWSAAPHRPDPSSPPVRRPRRRPSRVAKALLIVGALLAGAASAAGVIGGMQYLAAERAEGEEEDATRAIPPPDPSEGAIEEEGSSDEGPAAGTPTPDVEPTGSATDGSGAAAEGGDAIAADDAIAEDTPTSRRRRRRSAPRVAANESASRRAPRPAAETADEPEASPAAPSTPLEAIRMARAARRGDDPNRCIELLDDAIRSGAPPIALRYRADCYESAGRRADAVRDYQRFCRIAHDNPAITEVRPLLDSWGHSCP